MDSSRSTASGDLLRTPLAHLFVYAMDHSLTGTIALNAGGAELYRVVFRGGACAGILGVAEGEAAGAITQLFALPPATTFEFIHGEPEPPAAWFDPLALLWAGLSRYAEHSSKFKTVLNVVPVGPLCLAVDAPLARLGLTDDALLATECILEFPTSAESLVDSTIIGPQPLQRLLYALLITRMLIGAAQAPEDPSLSAEGANVLGRIRLVRSTTILVSDSDHPDPPADMGKRPAILAAVERSTRPKAVDPRAEPEDFALPPEERR